MSLNSCSFPQSECSYLAKRRRCSKLVKGSFVMYTCPEKNRFLSVNHTGYILLTGGAVHSMRASSSQFIQYFAKSKDRKQKFFLQNSNNSFFIFRDVQTPLNIHDVINMGFFNVAHFYLRNTRQWSSYHEAEKNKQIKIKRFFGFL